jgi:hypothetical protein
MGLALTAALAADGPWFWQLAAEVLMSRVSEDEVLLL